MNTNSISASYGAICYDSAASPNSAGSSFESDGGSSDAGTSFPFHFPQQSFPQQVHSQQPTLLPPTAIPNGNSSGNQPGSAHSSRPTSPVQHVNFVNKLFRMISDGQHTSLIHWSPEGKSFIVTDSATFARKVLPMYFKHSAFQSFVRQLNMYGFHKVNRPPRGQRGSENQTFEFKHSQFQRDREDLLDTIKRKNNEGLQDGRRDLSSVNATIGSSSAASSIMSDIHYNQVIATLQARIVILEKEQERMRQREHQLEQTVNGLVKRLHQLEEHAPSGNAPVVPSLQTDAMDVERPPPIFVFSHDQDNSTDQDNTLSLGSMQGRPHTRLTVQTQNLNMHRSPLSSPSSSCHPSPVLSSDWQDLTMAINTPLPASPYPSTYGDEDLSSVSSAHNPLSYQHNDPCMNAPFQQQQQQEQQPAPPALSFDQWSAAAQQQQQQQQQLMLLMMQSSQVQP